LGRRINVEVEYLGFVAQLTGKKEETFTLEDDFNLQALLESVLNRYQSLFKGSGNLLVAVNKRVVQPNEEKWFLLEGDRVTVGFKISGG